MLLGCCWELCRVPHDTPSASILCSVSTRPCRNVASSSESFARANAGCSVNLYHLYPIQLGEVVSTAGHRNRGD